MSAFLQLSGTSNHASPVARTSTLRNPEQDRTPARKVPEEHLATLRDLFVTSTSPAQNMEPVSTKNSTATDPAALTLRSLPSKENGTEDNGGPSPPPNSSIMDRVNKYKQDQEAKRQKLLQRPNAISSNSLFNRSAVSPDIHEQRERLPIYAQRDALIDCVRNNQFVIVIGDTGSGKSTQIPQYLAEAGIQGRGIIGVTQPRRVAATDLAKRVAKECGVALGSKVGYAVRFKKEVSKDTVIKYMTDGVLVKECSSKKTLETYSVIIIDEAHERSIHTDVCFGLLKKAAMERRDLKVIISSATLETEKFSEYFNGAPVFKVGGGQEFGVKIVYDPKTEDDYMVGAVGAVMNINRRGPAGDILVFLPGQEEIEMVADLIQSKIRESPNAPDKLHLQVTCCYGALSLDEQREIFKPAKVKHRKVVLATNIAETSITVDGIVYVIDCGFLKQNKYFPSSGVYVLQTQRITKFNAIQRAGRAGRTRSGFCIRLYHEYEYSDTMKDAASPEITRSNVEAVILDIIAMGTADPTQFDFMDPPPELALMEAIVHLQELSALDANGMITDLGRRMSAFPLDPPLAKVVIESERLGCSAEVIKIVALLCTQYDNLFCRTRRDRDKSDGFKERFDCQEGDMITLLKIFDLWLETGCSPDWCRVNNIQYRYLAEAKDIRKQLQDILNKTGNTGDHRGPLPPAPASGRRDGGGNLFEKIGRAFTAGYFRHLAKKKPLKMAHDYQLLADVTNVQDVFLHPSSALFKTKPQWVIYHEVQFTSKLYLRGAIAIEPAWVTEYAPEFASNLVRFGVPAAE